MFQGISFIKPDVIFDPTDASYAPMFRKRFVLDEEIQTAVLSVCGLGYGYYWLNETAVSEDLFTAPLSDYSKTLWYNRYDVSDKLVLGENIFAVMLGNGWYNECVDTVWEFDHASWRDIPKFILKLEVNGRTVLTTDETWKYSMESPIVLN